jgi:hypothetical protein
MQDLLERDSQTHEARPVLRVIPGGADQRHGLGLRTVDQRVTSVLLIGHNSYGQRLPA